MLPNTDDLKNDSGSFAKKVTNQTADPGGHMRKESSPTNVKIVLERTMIKDFGGDVANALKFLETQEKTKTNPLKLAQEKTKANPLKLVPVPAYISASHFISKVDENELWKDIQQILSKKKGVDFETGDHPKFPGSERIYAVFHRCPKDSGGSCQFNVQIFCQENKETKESNNLVEFQHRSGSSWAFQTLFQGVMVSLQKKHHDLGQFNPQTNEDQELKRFGPILLDIETFNSIFSIADSEFVDVVKEGMEILAVFSSIKENQEFLQERSELVGLLKKTLDKEVGDYIIQHHATVISANLSTQEKFREILTREKIMDQLDVIDEGQGYPAGMSEDFKRIYCLYLKDMKRQIRKIRKNFQ